MKIKLILLALVASVTLAQAEFYRTLYVDKDGSNTAPYDSLSTAATEIQTAVDEANIGDTVIVYNNGTPYHYGYTATPGYTAPNRVVITKNITVRSQSGFASTVISGTPLISALDQTKVRCVYMTAGTLKGFIIEKGTAKTDPGNTTYDQSGGGVLLLGTARLENCIVRNCTAINDGGGTYGEGTLLNCIISDNAATNYGGGSYLGTFTDCTLSGNSATNGGGSYQGEFINCTFTGNTAFSAGGGSGLGVFFECSFTSNSANYGGGSRYGSFSKCIFIGNTANSGGGCAQSTLTNCTLTGNIATSSGGGSYSSTLIDCSLANNSASDGGGNYGGTMTDCLLTGNSASHNGGGTRLGTLLRCTLTENSAVTQGGGTDGGTLTECSILDNTSDNNAGGCCNATLNRCIVSGNSAYGKGGGIYGYSTGSSATNSIFVGNSAIWGGGTYGDVVLHNCTIKGNSAINDGGGCYKGKIYNSIIVNNLADTNGDGLGSGDDLFDMTNVLNCCTPILAAGQSGITNAPKFADFQLHLRADSPCIDTGVQQGPIGPDFDGIFRPLDGTGDGSASIDMGAYEFASPLADTDGDGLNDAQEVELGADITNTDTDGDGRSDGAEVAQGLSPTYNEAPAITMGEENVLNDPAAHDLYTTNSIQDLNMGLLMLQNSNGTMNLSMQLQTTSDIASGTWSNAGDAVEWQHPADANKAFFRIRSE